MEELLTSNVLFEIVDASISNETSLSTSDHYLNCSKEVLTQNPGMESHNQCDESSQDTYVNNESENKVEHSQANQYFQVFNDFVGHDSSVSYDESFSDDSYDSAEDLISDISEEEECEANESNEETAQKNEQNGEETRLKDDS